MKLTLEDGRGHVLTFSGLEGKIDLRHGLVFSAPGVHAASGTLENARGGQVRFMLCVQGEHVEGDMELLLGIIEQRNS